MSQSILQAVVVGNAPAPTNQEPIKIALRNPNGSPYNPETGANAPLTGYVDVLPGSVSATDTLLTAIAKLEARIEALEAP